MNLQVEVYEAKYPRKASQYSVWVVDADDMSTRHSASRDEILAGVERPNKMYCAHPQTDKARAELAAIAFRSFIANGGADQILAYVKENY